ncbi:MAG: hypothetical protein EBV84_14420, partial [Betaproteobacteria bacterium]|nr:hypothetical protein [Betaproteobacteria bacterium]
AKPDHTSSAFQEFAATQKFEIKRRLTLPIGIRERIVLTVRSGIDAFGNCLHVGLHAWQSSLHFSYDEDASYTMVFVIMTVAMGFH